MKKICFFMIFVAGMICSEILPVNAAPDVMLRIGLESQYKNVATIPIANKQILVGYGESGGFQKAAELKASSGFSAVPAGQYYVRLEESFNDYTHAKLMADNYVSSGFSAFIALLGGNSVTVYIGGYNTQSEAAAVNMQVPAATRILSPDNRRVALQDGGLTVAMFENTTSFGQVRGVNGEPVTLKERKYRGSIEFARLGGQTQTAVNVLSIDEYLCAVVPSEMPSSWNSEALKAQAVAGRSYMTTRMGIHSDSGYDLCDGAHCQQYQGAGNEAQSTNQAVLETSGLMAYYENQVINAVYFSSSGGVTADAETVWTNAIPYLRGVADSYETTGKQWQRSFSLSEITALLNRNNKNIGSATGVRIGSTSSGGRVNELIITGTGGSITLTKEEIRNFFNSAQGGSLESRFFAIGNEPPQTTVVNAASVTVFMQGINTLTSAGTGGLYASSANGMSTLLSQGFTVIGNGTTQQYNAGQSSAVAGVASYGQASSGNNVVFSGRGWGHGVGMSQHGANAMAGMGYSFYDILKHYYTGIEIH